MDTIVVAPHLDDETLGCGGRILQRKNVGVILGTSEPEESTGRLQAFYGLEKVYPLRLVGGMMDTLQFQGLIEILRDVLEKELPHTVFMPFRFDAHSDHRVLAEATLAACKVFRTPEIKTLYMYETLSETNLGMEPFCPDTFLDISNVLPKKLEMVRSYKDCEMMHGVRSTREVTALAIYRGTQAGLQYAEAFMTVRNVIECTEPINECYSTMYKYGCHK